MLGVLILSTNRKVGDIQLHKNYVYTRTLGLNVEELKQSTDLMSKFITNSFEIADHNDCQSSVTTKLYSQYNLLMYPVPGIHKLYSAIRETFHECNGEDETEFFIQCWLNYYASGEFIDWHSHWQPQYSSWHGFVCVDVEPNSKTTYKVPPEMEELDIPSKNGLMVLSRSNGDVHRSSEWDQEYPRITIAFDIVPADILYRENRYTHINHWIPI